jgi:hypothetical protein
MKRTSMPTIAGVFNIVIGAINLLGVLGVAIALVVISNSILNHGSIVIPILWAVLVALIVFGIPSIVGGIFAVQRRNWAMALIGSIASFITWNLIGLVPLILVALSKDEFDQPVTAFNT